jgi:hypothetical protein
MHEDDSPPKDDLLKERVDSQSRIHQSFCLVASRSSFLDLARRWRCQTAEEERQRRRRHHHQHHGRRQGRTTTMAIASSSHSTLLYAS